MPYRPSDTFYLSFATQDLTGAATNADSTPSATLRRNGSNSAVTVTVTNNAAGDYTASGTIPATWAGGDKLELLVSATVKGVAGKAIFGLGSLDRNTQDAARVLLGVAGTVWFVSTSGNDSNEGKSWDTSFATIAKAITVASSDDVIDIGPGTFACGNAVLNLPDGVSLFGAGPKRTTINSTADLTSIGCIVRPGNNSTIAHLGIVGAGSGVYQAGFGFNGFATTAQSSASNWLLDDVYIEGDTDGIYFRNPSSTPAQVRGVIRNCIVRTKYDTLNVIGATSVAWDLVIDLIGFNDLRALGPSVVGSSAGTNRTIVVYNGTVRLFGGYYEASGGSSENYALALRDAGSGDATARIECYGGYILSSGTNAIDAFNGGGTLVLAGTQYDPTKTFGTVSVRAVPINRAGQIDTVALPAVTLAGTQSYNNTGQTTPLPTTSGFIGPNTVTFTFKDASANLIAGVIFTVAGVGSAAADGSGSKTVSLPSGNYTIKAAPTSGVFFADTSITVSTSATFTITGTALAITPASAPGQTTAYLTTRDGQGNALPNVTLTFQLVDPQSATDSFDQTAFTATSDGSALLQVPLIKSTMYQARVGGGPWVPFATGNGLTFALPEVLGTYSQ